MSTKVKIEIQEPHPPYEVRVTAQYKNPDGTWVDAAGLEILRPIPGESMTDMVYGTRRLIVEELPEKVKDAPPQWAIDQARAIIEDEQERR